MWEQSSAPVTAPTRIVIGAGVILLIVLVVLLAVFQKKASRTFSRWSTEHGAYSEDFDDIFDDTHDYDSDEYGFGDYDKYEYGNEDDGYDDGDEDGSDDGDFMPDNL